MKTFVNEFSWKKLGIRTVFIDLTLRNLNLILNSLEVSYHLSSLHVNSIQDAM